MRIAMIGSRGIPAGVGGVEHVVEDLTRELTLLGHDVLVYGRRNYVGGGRAEFGRCIVTPGLGGKHLEAITHTATAVWDVLRRDVDIIHVHSPGPALWSWFPGGSQRPVVFTVHAPDWRREKWSLPAQAVLQAGLEIGMRTARAVTAVSRNLADELQSRFRRTVVYVPNGVAPATDLAPDRIKQWSLGTDGFALHVGRIVPEKRLDVLLEAWGRAQLPIPLVIAAESTEKHYAERCRRTAPPGALFVGPQYGPVLGELYSNAAMVIQPSVLEGASLVLLEAGSHGRCVVSADIPANREILGNAGMYFPADNSAELAERIRRCYHETSLREELGRKARQKVRSAFSCTKVAKQMEQVYRNVLRAGE